jgi:RNA polymerase sigma-70 factor, ECF subfamily
VFNTAAAGWVGSIVHALAPSWSLMSEASAVDPDLELVEQFQAGDRRAFDQLVRRHQKGLWRVVRRYVRSDADAADVTQQAFVRAFKGLVSFRRAATVRSWLYRIAINCALSWLRDHRREQPTEIAEDALAEAAVAPTKISDGQDAARLRDAVALLPPKQRMVLELRVFDDLSFKEVAELAECTENTAKVNFHYAVKRLRDILNQPSKDTGTGHAG